MIFSTHNVAFALSFLLLAPLSLGSRLSQCTNWSLRFGWLVATCPNDANPPVLVESSLLLRQIVAVNEKSEFIVRHWLPIPDFFRIPKFVAKYRLVESEVCPYGQMSRNVRAGQWLKKYRGNYDDTCDGTGVENGTLFGSCVLANHSTVKSTLDLSSTPQTLIYLTEECLTRSK